MPSVLCDFKELMEPLDHPISVDEKWAEAVKVLRRIAFSGGPPDSTTFRVGNRPLAGGIEVFAKLFLARHGIGENGSTIHEGRCPMCGGPAHSSPQKETTPEDSP